MNVNKKIVETRKQKGLTQEDLAELIGVSAQTISKWENAVTMPDILLLPVIANIFEITIDELFNESRKKHFSISMNDIYEEASKELLTVMQKAWWNDNKEYNLSFEKLFEDWVEGLKEVPKTQTAIIKKNGVVYYKDSIGGLILKKPSNGWLSCLSDETANDLLDNLSNNNFIKVLLCMLNKLGVYTVNTISKKCGLCEADSSAILENMVTLGIATKKDLEVENDVVYLYELFCTQKLFHLFAVKIFAAQFINHKDCYHGYSGDGDFYS